MTRSSTESSFETTLKNYLPQKKGKFHESCNLYISSSAACDNSPDSHRANKRSTQIGRPVHRKTGDNASLEFVDLAFTASSSILANDEEDLLFTFFLPASSFQFLIQLGK